MLTVLRYIEANPLRATIVRDAADYPWSSYRAHGLGEANALLDPLVTYQELAANAAVRQRQWAAKVHRPLAEDAIASIRRSNESGLPYGGPGWVARLAKRLKLDLTIRPRGRPRKTAAT